VILKIICIFVDAIKPVPLSSPVGIDYLFDILVPKYMKESRNTPRCIRYF